MSDTTARDARIAALLRKAADELDPAKPAKATRKVQARVEPKAAAKSQPKAVRAICKANRLDFVEEHKWAKGMSVLQIAEALLSGERKARKGWTVGEGYKARVVTGAWAE